MPQVKFKKDERGPRVWANCTHVIHNGKEIPGIQLDKDTSDSAVFEQFKAWLKYYGFTIVPRGRGRLVVLSPTLYDCRKQKPFEWPVPDGE
jgi:hypothetical protein